MSWLCRIILKFLGWQVKGIENVFAQKQCVIIVAPHTSNWDFPLGLLVRTAYKMFHVKYLGKESLFKPPFGWLFKALGGYPVVRSANKNQVQAYVDALKAEPGLAIVLAPEGTRKKVDHFKTGFYYIAKGANIPIIPCKFDFQEKVVDFGKPIICGDQETEEISRIENYFRAVPGKNPAFNF